MTVKDTVIETVTVHLELEVNNFIETILKISTLLSTFAGEGIVWGIRKGHFYAPFFT